MELGTSSYSVLGLVGTEHLQVGKPPQYVTTHPCQLSLLPSLGQEMSTNQNTIMLCRWGVKEGMAIPYVD